MQVVQVTSITVSELINELRKAIPQPSDNVKAVSSQASTTITVLNKKDAAKMLGISQTFFTKLQARGCVPATVNAGFNNRGDIIWRWAQHHIISIKPVIMELKHKQTVQAYLQAKRDVHHILGL